MSCLLKLWSQKMSTRLRCSLQGRQNRWAKQPFAVDKALLQRCNETAGSWMYFCWIGIKMMQIFCHERETFVLIFAYRANFNAAIACNIPQWSCCTDQVIRRLQGDPYEALCSQLNWFCKATSPLMFRLCCFGPFPKRPKQLSKMLWLCSTL